MIPFILALLLAASGTSMLLSRQTKCCDDVSSFNYYKYIFITTFAGLADAKTAYQALVDQKLYGFAGMISTLEKGYGLYTLLSDPKFKGTVFAPTESAYTAMEAAANDLGALADIIKYHIVPSEKVSTRKLKKNKGVQTWDTSLPSHQIKTEVVKNSKRVIDEKDQSAKLVKKDIRAGKAIIHIVDKVLSPRLQ